MNVPESIGKLEEKAKQLKELNEKHGKRKPVLIEFCGTPKSGKSTSITALNIFLKRNGFNTEVVNEMANICPIQNKTHPNFNLWTLFSSLSEIIEYYSNNTTDFILVDRSIFDALCWFEWLNTSNKDAPYLDDKAYQSCVSLLTGTKLLSGFFSLTLVFKARPEVAMRREFAFLLTEKKGSIMNEHVLSSFNTAIESCLKKYKTKFNKVVEFDTSDKGKPEVVNQMVTETTLDSLLSLIKENIGYLPKEIAGNLKEGINSFDVIKNECIIFGERDKIEETDNIQPIPIAVITNESRDRVLIVKKSEKKTELNSPERNRYLLYVGGHIRQDDCHDGADDLLDVFRHTIYREIAEEIGESIYAQNVVPFLIYDSGNHKSKKHLAVCFVIQLSDFDNKNFKIVTDEFVKKAGRSKSGHSIDITEIAQEYAADFEPWSQNILRHVFNKTSTKTQLELFASSNSHP